MLQMRWWSQESKEIFLGHSLWKKRFTILFFLVIVSGELLIDVSWDPADKVVFSGFLSFFYVDTDLENGLIINEWWGWRMLIQDHWCLGYIDFQIFNFTRPEGGIRVSRTLSTSSRIPTDNAVKFNIWKSIETFLDQGPIIHDKIRDEGLQKRNISGWTLGGIREEDRR